MQRLIDRALSGEEEALKRLNVGDHTVASAHKDVTSDVLASDFKSVATIYLAAKELNLTTLDRLSSKLLLYLAWINKFKFDNSFQTEPLEIEEKDILDQMKTLLGHPKYLTLQRRALQQ